MKERVLVLVIGLTASFSALAGGQEISAVKYGNRTLDTVLVGCSFGVRADFLDVRNGKPVDPNRAAECTASGKEQAKKYYEEVRALFKGKKPPPELVEWRLEWAAAFDASMPVAGDTERIYMQRVGEAKQKVDRATNKLEIALE